MSFKCTGKIIFNKLMWAVTECNFEHFSEDLQYTDVYGKGTTSVQTTELVFKQDGAIYALAIFL